MSFTRFICSYFLLFSCFCHFICCGVPFTLSILSLTANIGLPYLLLSSSPIEKIEPILIIFSTIVLILLILTEMHSKRIACTNQEDCEDEKCDVKQKKIRKNIYLSLSFYLFNLFVFTLERFWEEKNFTHT